MKKVLWILLCLPLSCIAQDYTHQEASKQAVASVNKEKGFPPERFFISLNGGVGFPLENYGIRNENLNPNEIQGCAAIGYSTNISAGVFVSGNIAIMLKAGLDINSVDQVIFSEKDGGQVQGDFKIQQYMGGIYYHLEIHPNIFLNVDALFGNVAANFPTSVETYNNTTTTTSFKNASVFGYTFGAGLERMLTQNIGVNCNLAFTSAELIYPSYLITSGSLSVSENNPLIMEFGALQLTVGVSAHF